MFPFTVASGPWPNLLSGWVSASVEPMSVWAALWHLTAAVIFMVLHRNQGTCLCLSSKGYRNLGWSRRVVPMSFLGILFPSPSCSTGGHSILHSEMCQWEAGTGLCSPALPDSQGRWEALRVLGLPCTPPRAGPAAPAGPTAQPAPRQGARCQHPFVETILSELWACPCMT